MSHEGVGWIVPVTVWLGFYVIGLVTYMTGG